MILYEYTTLIQLDPATIWLREDSPGNRAFFPDAHFVFNDDVGILFTDLVAMGSPMNTHSHHSPSARVLPTASEPSTSGLSHLSARNFPGGTWPRPTSLVTLSHARISPLDEKLSMVLDLLFCAA